MKLKYFVPLITFLLPTFVITYFMWPSCLSSCPTESVQGAVGMCVMWFFMALNYFLGVRSAVKDRQPD